MSVGRAILVASTLLLWGLILHALVTGQGLPIPIVVALVVSYLGVFVLGAMVPNLEMFGDVLSRVTEAPAGAMALTFDDGPDPRTTPEVLRLLARYDQRATFFVIGEKARRAPEILRAITEAGHELALHSMSHPYLYSFWTPRRVEADLRELQALLREHAGVEARFFRPPVLVLSPRTIAGAARAGVAVAGASIRAFDGTARAKRVDVERRLNRARPGDIVLLHDASERDDGPTPVTLTFLDEQLRAWSERGLRSRTLSELVQSSSD
jgi:peptidoglycan/xylan/chitin deacetylase (PgdA/CDA1 family)